eukprot:m.76966 g.76966  ORF g.76966 m.76966 type:complete len:468 (-) comp7900_c0_seq1:110-1513(-)
MSRGLWVVATVVVAVAVWVGQLSLQPDDHVVVNGKIRFVDLSRPKLPVWLSMIKTLLQPIAPYIAKDMADPDALMDTARHKTGLTDYGNLTSAVRENLGQLQKSVITSAGLHGMGTLFIRELFLERLSACLRLVDLLKKHPEITQEDVSTPLVIAGLPRTGTTHLHALLAASGDFRFVAFYEGAKAFDVDLNSKLGSVDPRRDVVADELWFLNNAVPLMPLMVKVTADSQVEDIYLECIAFLSMLFETILYIPEYSTFVAEHEQQSAMDVIKVSLQALQWLDRVRSPDPASYVAPRWVLKTPAHFERLPELFNSFPNARVVVTHRNPDAIIDSVCTMTTYLARLYSDQIDPTKISWLWIDRVVKLIGTMMRRADEPMPHEQIMHVQASAYWADPIGMVNTIYNDLLGEPIAPSSQARIQAYIDAHPRQGASSIEYSLTALGITRDEIWQKHGPILDAYVSKYLTPKA